MRPFSFLFARSRKEEVCAEHLIREHHRGRSLDEILKDAYVTNRLSPEQARAAARPAGRAARVRRGHRRRAPRRRHAASRLRRSSAGAALARELDHARPDCEIPRGDPVRLEDDDVLVGARGPGARPATTSCSSCTSSQSRTPRSTGSIRSPDSSCDCSRESQQTNAARSSTALSSSRRDGSFAPTAQTSAPSRSHSPRSTGSFDVVTVTTMSGVGGLAVRLGRLAVVLAAERGEPLGVAAVDDDALDRRHRRADARDLRRRLPAAADHAEARGALPGEVARRDGRGRAGPQLPELVGLDHRLEPRRRSSEKSTTTNGVPARRPGVRLEPGVAELAVDARHHRVLRRRRAGAASRGRLSTAPRGEPPERLLDRLERVGRREQLGDVLLAEVQRAHEADIVPARPATPVTDTLTLSRP